MKKPIEKGDGEFIILSEVTSNFQKKIRRWLSKGYGVTILHQSTDVHSVGLVIITASIVRFKL